MYNAEEKHLKSNSKVFVSSIATHALVISHN